jgi:hypothetical protein
MNLVLCSWCFVVGALYLVLCTWCFVLGALYLVLCTWCFVPFIFTGFQPGVRKALKRGEKRFKGQSSKFKLIR